MITIVLGNFNENKKLLKLQNKLKEKLYNQKYDVNAYIANVKNNYAYVTMDFNNSITKKIYIKNLYNNSKYEKFLYLNKLGFNLDNFAGFDMFEFKYIIKKNITKKEFIKFIEKSTGIHIDLLIECPDNKNSFYAFDLLLWLKKIIYESNKYCIFCCDLNIKSIKYKNIKILHAILKIVK